MKFIIAIWDMLKSKFSQERSPWQEMLRREKEIFPYLPKKHQERFLNPPEEIVEAIYEAHTKLFIYRKSIVEDALKELGEEVQV